jgi:murein L,D-transpeptidase YcbB/YkuD
MPRPSFQSRCRVLLCLFAVAASLAGRLAVAQEIDERIRNRIELLRANGMLEVGGESIASATLLPRVYEAQAFAPAWRTVAQIDSLLELILESEREGLVPADYHVEAVQRARAAFATLETLDPAERADFELILTDSVIRLGYHLRFGKVDPVALDTDWNYSRDLGDGDPVAMIQGAIAARSMRAFAAEVIPRAPAYLRLKDALARYRQIEADGGWPEIPGGPTLREGMSDPRVPDLIRRLVATGDLAPEVVSSEQDVYTQALVAGVMAFQRRHGLATDGALGAQTRAALNVPVADRIAELRINLERGRWVFNEYERDYILVNVAGFHLDLVRAGRTIWSSRVVVGQPYRRTPVFKAEMRYLVFNPTWTVPPGILRQDILPAQRRDPGYLASRGIDLIDADNAVVDPASIDWIGQRSFPYRFVQQPGPSNALGQVKFMFPNPHHVYLHDTPSRDLFDREARAFSSGCIRVENPLELAELLLGGRWDRARIEALIATGRSETLFLESPISVMLLYWTAEVDPAGRVLFWPDIYGRDEAVRIALDAPLEQLRSL